MPQRLRDVVGSMLTLLALVALLASFDSRVRDGVSHAVSRVADSTWQSPLQAVDSVVDAVRWNPYVDNAYLAAFLVAGGVLVVLMLRT